MAIILLLLPVSILLVLDSVRARRIRSYHRLLLLRGETQVMRPVRLLDS